MKLLFVLFISSILISCAKKVDTPKEWMDSNTTQNIMGNSNSSNDLTGIIIRILVVVAIAFFVGRDAKKRNMNSWGWGIFTLLFNIFALPFYFAFRWMNKGKIISENIYENRRSMLLRASLIMAVIGIVLIFLSTIDGSPKGELASLLFIGLFIGIPGAIIAIIIYTSKSKELNLNQTISASEVKQSNSSGLLYCHSCGNIIEKNQAQFCVKCGAKI